MIMSHSTVSPLHYCCPLVVREGDAVKGLDVEEEEVNPKHAMLSDPTVGMEKVTWEDGKGPGAIAAKPLPSPKPMSDAQRRIHDPTHLPYDPGCPICVSCKRPTDRHRRVKDRKQMSPWLVLSCALARTSSSYVLGFPTRGWTQEWLPE